MKITATQINTPRSTKIQIDKIDSTGSVLVFYTGNFTDHSDYVKCAKRIGVNENAVVYLINEVYRKGVTPAEMILTGNRGTPPRFVIRNETGTTDSATVVDDVHIAMGTVRQGQIIQWEGKKHVCVLDVDYSYHKPTPGQLVAFADIMQPNPAYYWLSKSGGLHCVYVASYLYDADELAAVGAYQIIRRFPNSKCELLNRTRAPYGACQKGLSNDDTSTIAGLLLENNTIDCEKWLTEREYEIGQRYPHTQCPVKPSERAKSNTPPVVVYEDHLYCYICAADGVCMGSRRAGYFPIPALSGGRVNTKIANAVENFVHYGHAQYILSNITPMPNINKMLYSALLKMKHGDDARIASVFEAGEPNGLIRYNGYWADKHGTIVTLEKSSAILKELPHCWKLQPNGGLELNPSAPDWLSKTIDHSVRGYYPVIPLRGIHITQHQQLPENKLHTVLQSGALAEESNIKRRPEYIPQSHRMNYETAWAELEKVFPGVNRTLIELLIVGRGCAEHSAGLPPMLFITGPTGVGKSSHVQIASAICGDVANVVHLKNDRDRFLNGLLIAKQNGGFVFFDEFFKYAKQARLDNVEAMQELLSFSPYTMVYLIHVGSIPFGEMPFFIWADNKIPLEILSHEQIGRRVHTMHLASEVSWEKPLADSGINKPTHLRLYGSQTVVDACNAILSHVIENHFSASVTDFADVCKLYNVKPLRDSDVVQQKYETVIDLFDAVCSAKPIEDSNDKKRFSSPGYKVTIQDSGDKLATAFSLCQSEHDHNTTQCSKVEECDLQKVCGLKTPAKLEVRKHGRKIAMRFVSLDGKLVNEQLRKL